MSFLPLWQSNAWWVRSLDFPRLQIAALLLGSTVVLAVLLKKRRSSFAWTTLAAALAALAWQASHFIPYLPLAPREVAGADHCPPERRLALLNVNVLQHNRDYPALLRLVRAVSPDILLLLETDSGWAKAVEPLNALYPHRIAEPLGNTYGLMLFSRLPMDARILHRLQPDIPSVEARIQLRGGDWIRFHGVHPEPPLPGDDSGERDAELVMVGRDVRRQGGAAIVMGDLNDVAWSRTSRLFGELAAVGDPRAGRGLYPTYHADHVLARWPLDHLFATPHFTLLDMQRLADIGSDHFPIFYRLCLTADASVRAAPAAAPAPVERQAREEVAEGLEERRAEERDD